MQWNPGDEIARSLHHKSLRCDTGDLEGELSTGQGTSMAQLHLPQTHHDTPGLCLHEHVCGIASHPGCRVTDARGNYVRCIDERGRIYGET